MADSQLSLDPPPILRVTEDYGLVGAGASQAHYALVENGQEYIIKGRTFVPGHPHVAANEYVAARLAQALGLPLLDFRVVEMAGELYFASAWMTQTSFHPQITPELFARCENRDRVYDLAVLDAWIANVDRHHQNLVVRETRPRGAAQARCLMLCNDHSHCLVLPGQTTDALASHLNTPPANYIRQELPFILDAIRDPARLSRSLARLAGLPDAFVTSVLNDTPASFFPADDDREAFRQYLDDRRKLLPDLFRDYRAAFPALAGGTI